jgi:hypothetical protein
MTKYQITEEGSSFYVDGVMYSGNRDSLARKRDVYDALITYLDAKEAKQKRLREARINEVANTLFEKRPETMENWSKTDPAWQYLAKEALDLIDPWQVSKAALPEEIENEKDKK